VDALACVPGPSWVQTRVRRGLSYVRAGGSAACARGLSHARAGGSVTCAPGAQLRARRAPATCAPAPSYVRAGAQLRAPGRRCACAPIVSRSLTCIRAKLRVHPGPAARAPGRSYVRARAQLRARPGPATCAPGPSYVRAASSYVCTVWNVFGFCSSDSDTFGICLRVWWNVVGLIFWCCLECFGSVWNVFVFCGVCLALFPMLPDWANASPQISLWRVINLHIIVPDLRRSTRRFR